jgi:hypothetical protein
LFLSLVVELTVLAWVTHVALHFLRRQRLRRLSSEWHMGYAQADLFNLAGRIAPLFPIPDATNLRIVDLIYCSEGPSHRYVFTAEYTCSIDGGCARERRVMTFCEPQGDSLPGSPLTLIAAPEELSIVEQYRYLQSHAWGQPPQVPNGAAA